MFTYEYDEETGGLLLKEGNVMLSKEPRPVYAQELNVLGVNEYWDYEDQNETPYLWAEANHYFYRGVKIFDTKGGTIYTKPEIVLLYKKDSDDKPTDEPILKLHSKFEPVDIAAMCKKNSEQMNILEQVTCKNIYNIYKKYEDRVDCFHVAFSGGKDSIVLLELVKKALPLNSFIVIFGDTEMEFPDTYDVIDIVEADCKERGISFYRAKSHLKPEESWRLFGPPSRVLRWCCSVHKSAPQILKLREILGKNDYVGLDFVGVRKHESQKRAEYEEENYGAKQKGQYSHNSILEWTSAEVWMYIYVNNLLINNAYKKGNSRVGCLFCPLGGDKNDYFQYKSYSTEIDKFINIIKELNEKYKDDEESLSSYVSNGGWNARKNARDLAISNEAYQEEIIGDTLIIKLINPKSSWKEWIKVIDNFDLNFQYTKKDNEEIFKIKINKLYDKFSDNINKRELTIQKLYKQVFKKASTCIGCKVCEANCRTGRLSFEDSINISNCIHCNNCQDLPNGCLVFHSLLLPKEGKNNMSINSFANHAPKLKWINELYNKEKENNNYWENNSLGTQEIPRFKKFLRGCGFIDNNNKYTKLFEKLLSLGLENKIVWGIALTNISYNPQFIWYNNNLKIGKWYERDYVSSLLINEGVKRDDASSIIVAFRIFSDMQFGTVLGYGNYRLSGKKLTSLIRNKSNIKNDIVLLYSLYKYAEMCGGYYQFTLSTLMDIDNGSTGVSPIKIFGYDRDDLEAMLNGLSVKYNDYIDFTQTHDLEKITLSDYHKSEDIIDLI